MYIYICKYKYISETGEAPPAVPPARGKLCIVYMYFVQMRLHIQVQIHMQMRLHDRVHNEKCMCIFFTSDYTLKYYIDT